MVPRVVHSRGALCVARGGKLGGQRLRARCTAKGIQQKIQRAGNARRRGAAHTLQKGAQFFHYARAQGLGARQLLRLLGRGLGAKTRRAFFKGGAPVCRLQLPGIGIVFQKGNVAR